MGRRNGATSPAGSQLTQLVRDSASQVLEVGRGAYGRAGEGGGRLVGGLLSLGGRLDREAKSRVFEVRNTAAEALERLEHAFVHRVARALNAMQIPTARDVQELNRRVADLQQAVVALERRAAAAAEAGKRAAPAPTARRKKAGAPGKAAAAKARAAKLAPRTQGPAGT